MKDVKVHAKDILRMIPDEEFPCRQICSNKTNVPADLQSAGI